MKLKTTALLTAVLASAFCFTTKSRASIEIFAQSATENMTTGIWDYAYSMYLTAGDTLETRAGNQSVFIFYDYDGLSGVPAPTFVGSATSATDWTISEEATSPLWNSVSGPTGSGESSLVSEGGTIEVPDSSLFNNIRFQYDGAGLSSGSSNVFLGTANIFSTLAPSADKFFDARWTNSGGVSEVNTDTPIGPGPNVGAGNPPSPEPASLALLGLGAVALLGRRRKSA